MSDEGPVTRVSGAVASVLAALEALVDVAASSPAGDDCGYLVAALRACAADVAAIAGEIENGEPGRAAHLVRFCELVSSMSVERKLRLLEKLERYRRRGGREPPAN